MRDSRVVRDYDDRLKEYRRIRKQLADYIDLITTEFGDSGLTVHAILGKSIATNDRLAGISNDTLERCKLGSETQTKSGFAVLSQLGFQIESAHAGTLAANKHWQKTRLVHPDRFTVEEACALASRASTEALTLNQAREALTPWSLDPNETSATLEGLAQFLAGSSDLLQHHPKDLLIAVLTDGKASALSNFLSGCTAMAGAGEQLAVELSEDPDENALHKVKKVEEICLRASLPTIASGDLADLLEARKKAAGAARAVAAALQPLVQACEAARTWLLDDLVKAQALYREAGREAMALRSPRLADGNAAHHLRKLCDEGIGLQRERSALSERVTLTAEISVESLIECVSTLRTAGTFAFLSPRYRNAKKRFRSISRSPSYSKADAIRCLDDVIAFRRKSGEFIKQAEANKLFGMYYRGLDTEFEPFARLAGFCEALAKHFSGPKHVTLQKFLREATVGHLDLMPAWPPTNIGITFDSLGDRITNTTNEVRVLETAIADLHNVADVFRDPNADIASIRSAKAHLEELLSERTKLDTHGVARELLRDHFKGHRTAAARFEGLVAWAQSAQLMASMVQRVLGAGSPIHAGEIIAAVLSAEANLSVTLARMSDVAKINPSAFMEGRSLAQAAELLAKAAGDSEGLFAFAGFAGALQDAGPQGIMPLVEERTRGGSLQGLGAQIEALAVRQLAKAVFAQYGNKLSRFRGTKLDELRTELAQKDKEIIQLSRKQLRAKVKTVARPPGGNGMGKKSTWTDMALIDNEVSKKQRFIAVRDLTQRAGRALLELKPCWMMSPLAVAQYIPKGSIEFDLCIIDEASQMPPESAIGALLRCGQAVVVGDTNQLPPSSFFKTMIDDEEADEDEAVLNESVLELANGAFRPARRLRWHYRSRHSGLIKFSNRLVYDDKLIVFPSATEAMSRMGVEFRSVEGRYKAGTNPVEAKSIVEAIIEFMRTDPDRSLGVVTLNQKQRDLIKEEFDYAIANDRAVQKYIDTWNEKNEGLEYFFIKNLENVQGDERDVIFIGTVYGAEEPGARVMQRFGPINGLAGKRRLNVLFTRAKQKIVTFTSMTGADIETDEFGNPGTYMLKRWLEYAASGVLDAGEETEKDPDSDFEVFVIDRIRAMGCKPVPQVGVAGYFVDIGIRHPDWPHGFLMGVECDGATYHSAKSARDRDRLRQEILEGLGWNLHRIWSTDWFNNPQQQADRLRKAVSERLAFLKAREHEFVQPQKAQSVPAPAKPAPVAQIAELFDFEAPVAPSPPKPAPNIERRVEIGDTVRVRYLTDDQRTVKITISKTQSDPSRGIVHHGTPVASALLGAEEGDEVEVLVGSYIRPAIIETITKAG